MAEYITKFLRGVQETLVLKSRPVKGYPAGSSIFMFIAQIGASIVFEQKYGLCYYYFVQRNPKKRIMSWVMSDR